MHVARIMANDGHSQKYIAEKLGVTDRMVRNYLKSDYGTKPRKKRESILTSYHPIIDEILTENPYFNLIVLYERLKKSGYSGKITILRDYARTYRNKMRRKAVLRFETEPGRQAQVDWKECGKWLIDGKEQKLYAFVMLLGYSRKPFVLFTLDMTLSTLLLAHLAAFEYFGAVPQEILYDNMKTAWLNQSGIWNVNPKLLSLASSCGFTPKRCQVRRPQTKGKVERFIGYLGHNFLPRKTTQMAGSLDDLNREVLCWLKGIEENQIGGQRKTRKERFEEEKPHMNLWVPEAAPDVRLTLDLMVSREGTFCYQTNRYSLDAEYIGQIVTLKINTLNGNTEIFFNNYLIRTLTLLPKGSHGEIITDEDRLSLLERWKTENSRMTPPPKKNSEEDTVKTSWFIDVEVDIRHPSVFDDLQECTA